MESFRVQRATALCYRIYDVAEEIDLEAARRPLQTVSSRLKLQRQGSEYLQVSNPPLAVELGSRTLEGQPVEVAARVFDHGALSLIVRVPIRPGTTLAELVGWADALYDSAAVDALCAATCEELRVTLGSAMKDPHRWEKCESYTVLLVRQVEGDPTGAALLQAPELPALLVGEAKESLSAAERKDVLQHAWSYGERDLVVVDWNAAFVYEPSGSTDIPDVLEIANAQLLELRYFDDVLDRELGRVYDAIEARKGGGLLQSPYKKLMRELMLTLIELSGFIERVENTLKIVGDVYLARVYEGALAQLRIAQWQKSVMRKHALLAQIYGLLKGEVDTARSLTLEAMIVVLIVVELAMAAVKALVG